MQVINIQPNAQHVTTNQPSSDNLITPIFIYPCKDASYDSNTHLNILSHPIYDRVDVTLRRWMRLTSDLLSTCRLPT